MAEAKASRTRRQQLGQFLTPDGLAERIVGDAALTRRTRILEPSFGDGAFVLPLIRRLLARHAGSRSDRLGKVLTENLWGVEIDEALRERCLARIASEFGPLPAAHNLTHGDFFAAEYEPGAFDLVIGNPPFGGTIDPALQDRLDRLYGRWDGHKLKKETYSFFIAKSLDLLAPDGRLLFIASDTFMTINTMAGLRRKLMDRCAVRVDRLDAFSGDTLQPTLVLHAVASGRTDALEVDGVPVPRALVDSTGNFSWGIAPHLARYFEGPTIGDVMVASSGMTIGRNEWFVREIRDGAIEEPFEFVYFEDPITLDRERQRARLHKLSPRKARAIADQEARGETRRNVSVRPLEAGAARVTLPNADYRSYNKATSRIVYAPPAFVVYWRDDGDAVRTFKRNGNWYLGGVGGEPFFGREGLTWSLISSRLTMRYLPQGYVLDSGAPLAVLRPGVAAHELWFVLGWALTAKATEILKTVVNHTRNIQSKDVERLPYPFWVDRAVKEEAIAVTRCMVGQAVEGRVVERSDPELATLERLFAHPGETAPR